MTHLSCGIMETKAGIEGLEIEIMEWYNVEEEH